MKALALYSLPAFALLAACGEDSAIEDRGDLLEMRADAVDQQTKEVVETLEERADAAPTDAMEDTLDERAEVVEEIGGQQADAINETADQLE